MIIQENTRGQNSNMEKQPESPAIDVRCYQVESPADFWLVLFDEQTLGGMQLLLYQLYEGKSNIGTDQYKPGVGDLVVAQSREDGAFYRAKVTQTDPKGGDPEGGDPEGGVKVRLVDFGFQEALPITNVHPITEKDILEIPEQAVQCSLAGVTPVGGSKNYTEDAIDWLKGKLTGGSAIKAVLVETPNGSINHTDNAGNLLYVDLYDESGCKLNEEMVKQGLAAFITQESSVKPNLNQPQEVTSQEVTAQEVTSLEVTSQEATSHKAMETEVPPVAKTDSQQNTILEPKTDDKIADSVPPPAAFTDQQVLPPSEAPLQAEPETKPSDVFSITDLPQLPLPGEVEATVTQAFSVTDLYIQPQNESIMAAFREMLSILHSANLERGYEPSVGELVLAMYSADNMWYRAGVVEVTTDKFKVTFCDYGNIEMVTKQQIAKIPQALVEFPPFAVRCTLTGISPGPKPFEPAKLENNLFSVKFLDVKENIKMVTLVCPQTQTDVIKWLIQEDYAVKESQKSNKEIITHKEIRKCTDKVAPEPAKEPSQEKPDMKAAPSKVIKTQDLPSITLSPQAVVAITEFENFNSFFVHVLEPEFQEIMKEVSLELSKTELVGPYVPSAGEVVIAKFSVDQVWYRAQVLEITEQKFKVRFLDFGNKDVITSDDISKFSETLMKFPPLAVNCKLSTGSETAVDSFDHNLLCQRHFIVNNVEKDGATSIVQLLDIEENKDLCQILKEAGIISTGIEDVPVKDNEQGHGKGEVEDSVMKKDEVKESIPQEGSKSDSQPGIEVQDQQKVEMEQNDDEISVLEDVPEDVPVKERVYRNNEFPTLEDLPEDQLPDECLFLCLVAESISSFYLVPRDPASVFLQNSLSEEIVRCRPDVPYKPHTHEIVMVLSVEFNEWYRAEIEAQDRDRYHVYYIDYGNREVVNTGRISSMPPSLLEYPVFAKKCSFSNLSSEYKSWDKSQLELKQFLAHIVGKKNGTYLVSLDGTKNEQEHATKPQHAEPEFKAESEVSKIVESGMIEGINSVSEQRYTLSDLPKLGIPQEDSIEVFVTDATHPMHFWIQIVKKEMAQKLHDLEMKITLAGPQAGYAPNKGEIVLARFTDNCWYRAKVHNISEGEDKKYTLVFIDYGNSTTASVKEISRLLPALLDCHPMAVRCRLHGVEVTESNKCWEPALFLDKRFNMKIIVDSDDFLSVELTDRESGDPIVKNLVLEGFVTRKDTNMGSRKIHRAIMKERFFFDDLPKLPLLMNQAMGVRVCDVASLYYIYVHVLDKLPVLKTISLHIENNKIENGYNPQKNEIVLAEYNNYWYRAQVCAEQNDIYSLFFIDFGNTCKVTEERVAKLPVNLIKYPPLAVLCRLNDAFITKKIWDEHENILINKEFKCVILQSHGIVHFVDLFYRDTGTNVKVNLLNHGFISMVKFSLGPERQVQSRHGSEVKQDEESHIQNQREEERKFCNKNAMFHTMNRDLTKSESPVSSEKVQINKENENPSGKIHRKVLGRLLDGQVPDTGDLGSSQLGEKSRSCNVHHVKEIGQAGSGEKSLPNLNVEHVPQTPIKSATNSIPVPLTTTNSSPVSITTKLPENVPFAKDTCRNSPVSMTPKPAVNTSPVSMATTSSSSSGRSTPVSLPSCFGTQTLRQILHGGNNIVMKEDIPIQTFSGDDVYIRVVHVVTSSEFYVHVLDTTNIKKFGKLMEVLNNLGNSDGGTYSPKVGEMVAAKSEEHQMWYRGAVKQIQDNKVTVVFTDYGSMEDIPCSGIRKMDRCLSHLPHQAVRCSLSDVPQPCSKFTAELLNQKDLLAKLVKKDKDTQYVEVFDNGLNLNEQLRIPEMLTLPREELDPKEETEVVVTHADNPGLFYVVLQSNVQSLVELLLTLEASCSADVTAYLPKEQEYVACPSFYGPNQVWTRALVQKVEDNKAYVTFVDIGGTGTVPVDSIRKLDVEFSKLPCQAIPCGLSGITSGTSDGQWSTKVTEYFTKETQLNNFTLTVFSKNDGSYLVDLKHMLGSVAEDLVSGGHGVETTQNGSLATSGGFLVDKLPQAELPKSFSVEVTDVVSPAEIYCMNTSEQTKETLVNLMNELQMKYSNLPAETEFTPQLNQLIAAKFPADGAWYRGVVLGYHGNQVSVRYVDFGNKEDVAAADVHPLDAQFCQLPAQGIRCSLAGIKPRSDSSWSDACIDYLQNLINHRPCNVTVYNQQVSPVEVLLDTDPGNDILMSVQQSLVCKGYASSSWCAL